MRLSKLLIESKPLRIEELQTDVQFIFEIMCSTY